MRYKLYRLYKDCVSLMPMGGTDLRATHVSLNVCDLKIKKTKFKNII